MPTADCMNAWHERYNLQRADPTSRACRLVLKRCCSAGHMLTRRHAPTSARPAPPAATAHLSFGGQNLIHFCNRNLDLQCHLHCIWPMQACSWTLHLTLMQGHAHSASGWSRQTHKEACHAAGHSITRVALKAVHPARVALKAVHPARVALKAVHPARVALKAVHPARVAFKMLCLHHACTRCTHGASSRTLQDEAGCKVGEVVEARVLVLAPAP
jgi:hypothetical protein